MKQFSLGGIALLKDLFASVTGRVNGFEHTLRRNRIKHDRVVGHNPRSGLPILAATTHKTTFFPIAKRNGAQECARRVRQMQRGQVKAAQS
jgi:hypothetical protein